MNYGIFCSTWLFSACSIASNPLRPPSTKLFPMNLVASPVNLDRCLNRVLSSPIASRLKWCSPVKTPGMCPCHETSLSETTLSTFGWNSILLPSGGCRTIRSWLPVFSSPSASLMNGFQSRNLERSVKTSQTRCGEALITISV